MLDKLAPFIADLYRSPALIKWLESVTGDKLQLSPADDPHAYALYFYTKPGDHIGWHYDTSCYDGRRYTVLFGVIDDSSCRLDYELHTKNPAIPDQPGSVQYPPGALVLFDGDKLRHRVSPLGENETRVSLTFEYVTDPNMKPFKRFISNMKDSIAYFGSGRSFAARAARAGRHEPRRHLPAVGRRGAVRRAARLARVRLGRGDACRGELGAGRGRRIFHLVPLIIDAGAISIFFARNERNVNLSDALLARWSGESVNSLMPVGQIGGPMLMVRYLAQRGMRARELLLGVPGIVYLHFVEKGCQCRRLVRVPNID